MEQCGKCKKWIPDELLIDMENRELCLGDEMHNEVYFCMTCIQEIFGDVILKLKPALKKSIERCAETIRIFAEQLSACRIKWWTDGDCPLVVWRGSHYELSKFLVGMKCKTWTCPFCGMVFQEEAILGKEES